MKIYCYKMLCGLLVSGAFLVGCSPKSSPDVPPTPGEKEKENAWNKNKTVEVYFLSELKDQSLANYNGVVDFFLGKGEKCSLGIIDRADVNYSTNLSGSHMPTQVAFKTAKFSAYALNRFSGNLLQGSEILYNHKLNIEESFKVTDDCYVKYLPVQMQTTTAKPIHILLPFATARFDSKAQIVALQPALKELAVNTRQAVLIGTVKKELIADLETAVKENRDYVLTTAVKNDLYTLFMAAPKSWVLREVTTTQVNSGLMAYCLSVEASVE